MVPYDINGNYVHKESMTEIFAMTYRGNYLLFELVETPTSSMYITNSTSAELIQMRMFHVNMNYIKKLCKVKNIDLHSTKSFHCEAYYLPKSIQRINRHLALDTTAPMQLIYFDLIDIKPMAMGSAKYCLQLIDNYISYP